MPRVMNSLSLDAIVDDLRLNNKIFWYVKRNGTVKKLTIKTKLPAHNFVRNYNFLVEVLNLNKNETVEEVWFNISSDDIRAKEDKRKIGGSGRMFDYYYKAGHFFPSQSCAFKYLKERINSKGKLVKTVKKLMAQYPEYIL